MKYSGDAKYLEFFIHELQSQHDKSYAVDVSNGQHTAEARVELNIPGLSIEYDEDTYPVLWT